MTTHRADTTAPTRQFNATIDNKGGKIVPEGQSRIELLEAVAKALHEVRAAEKEEDDLRERMRNLPNWIERRSFVDDFMIPNNGRQADAADALDAALAALDEEATDAH